MLTPLYTADYNRGESPRLRGMRGPNCGADRDRALLEGELPTGWNRIARAVADQRNLDAWDAARLFAVLAVGEFDAYTASLESKYLYNFWRPVTAVALAGTDNNPGNGDAAGWEVLAFPTPPVPDYPSAHSTAGGGRPAIIEALVPGQRSLIHDERIAARRGADVRERRSGGEGEWRFARLHRLPLPSCDQCRDRSGSPRWWLRRGARAAPAGKDE